MFVLVIIYYISKRQQAWTRSNRSGFWWKCQNVPADLTQVSSCWQTVSHRGRKQQIMTGYSSVYWLISGKNVTRTQIQPVHTTHTRTHTRSAEALHAGLGSLHLVQEVVKLRQRQFCREETKKDDFLSETEMKGFCICGGKREKLGELQTRNTLFKRN